MPDKPLAWLLTTARRKAVDRIRRDRTYADRLARLQVEADRAAPPVEHDDDIPDERLQLFFTCCHPALSRRGAHGAHPALPRRADHAGGGAGVPRAHRDDGAAPRAGQAQDPDARIPFRVPDADELPARLPGVLRVVYLIFTEGYAASAGADLMRPDLADEAIRLARILHRLLPANARSAGLLALLLLVDARRAARVDADGAQVLLDDQDRALWDADAIAEGQRLVVPALTGPGVGPYAVQAAIAALHDEASDVASTDWPQIVALYDVLLRLTPSPLVALNRAVAVAMADGPAAGLALLDGLADAPELRGYHLLPATRAELLARLGRPDGGRRGLPAPRSGLAANASERAQLERRLRLVSG